MAFTIQDLIDTEQFQDLQDRLNEIYSFPSAIIDNDGRILTATAWQDVCTKFHRQNRECEKECIKSDQYIAAHLHEANPAVSYQCPHGLIDNATPIIIEGIHYGNFFTGQFFLERPDLDFFRAQAKKYGFDEAAYLEAVKKVPIWTQEQLNSYLFFIKGLIEVISGIGLKNLREIEARKRIQESEERHRTIIETAMDGFWLLDLQGSLLEVNQAYCRMSGYSREELLGLRTSDLEAVDSEYNTNAHIQKLIAQGEDRFESRHRRKDGTIFDVEVSVQYRPVDGGRLVAFLRDISERMQAEKQIRESEHKYRALFETANDGIFLHGKGVFLDCNEEGARMYGLPREEVIGRSPVELSPERQPDGRLSADVAEEKTVAALSGEPQSFEWQARRADGVPLDVEITLSRVEVSGSILLLAIVRDITERKRLEEERRSLEERLHRSEKMEALGQLAGGVAHDLNNVLGVSMGYAELLQERIPVGNPLRTYSTNILNSTAKGAAIIEDLLTLARRGVSVSKAIDLNAVVSTVLSSPEFARLRGHHPSVTFKTELDPELLNISGSPLHLEKTIFNLISNATEAISGRGEVVLRTENRYLDRPVQGYDEVKDGDYAVLTISDSGAGIRPDDLNKIFEPFYTKKPMGLSGTGLGLSIVWGTVKDHHGYIDVRSTEGRGSTFVLYFPVTRERISEVTALTPVEGYLGHGESVLVVDDVAEQRQVATVMLTRLGYRVHAVASGEDAAAYLENNTADILVLDMIMEPGIDGLETYKRIREINPKQKAIIVSGFSETERVKEAQKLGAGPYVKKPYVMERIGVTIRQELDR